MQFVAKNRDVNIINAFAPNLAAETDQKDKFYQDLTDVLINII